MRQFFDVSKWLKIRSLTHVYGENLIERKNLSRMSNKFFDQN